MSDKVVQEFFCNEPHCMGYFRVRLNMKVDGRYKIVCPNCKHEHPRGVKSGRIVESYNMGKWEAAEEIMPMKSAWSKEPMTLAIKAHARDGVVINSEKDLRESVGNEQADAMLRDLWDEFHGDKL